MTRKSLFFAFVFCLCVFVHLVGSIAFAADIEINETNFPDANFRAYVSSADTGLDTNQDAKLSEEEIADIKEIDVSSKDIATLKGIEFFTALISLDCYNNQLVSIDISKNTALRKLSCFGNQFTTLDVSKNIFLMYLNCDSLTSIDVSKNVALTYLDVCFGQLTTLDVSKNVALTTLRCWNNQLTSLDVSKNTVLTELHCGTNQLTSLDISNNTALTWLNCSSNQLTALDVSNNTALENLYCGGNQLAALDLSNNPEFRHVGDLGAQNITSYALIATNDSEKPYCVSMNALGLDAETFNSRVSTIYDVQDSKSSGSYLSVSNSDGIIYFSGKPSSMRYSYNTNPSYSGNTGMNVTVTFVDTGITGISITSPDTKVINLPASGGSFDNVIVTVEGNVYGSLSFDVEDNTSYTPLMDNLNIGYGTNENTLIVKGKAPLNTNSSEHSHKITVKVSDNKNVTYSDSFEVIVAASGGNNAQENSNTNDSSNTNTNGRATRYQFSMSSDFRNLIASIFGVDASNIFQLTDSEILDESWTLEAGDSSSISNMGETVAINMPSVMPNNTGVYVMRYALDSSLAGKGLKVRGVTGSSSVSTSAIEDREYVFFDENYNEITSVPSDGIVYVAQRMTSGQTNKGVITTSDELPLGVIKPIEEASRDILREKIAEIKSVRTDEILFIEEENIYPAQEPPAIVVEQSKNDNANILAKFNTLSVDLSGLYVFHVILSDDVAREIESVDIDQLRIYAAEFESTGVFPAVYQASDGQVKTAFLYGLLNTFELLTMGGEKLKFGAKEFLMVVFLNASKPLSLYIGKILLALLMGGCNSGFGVTVLALIIGGVFISQKKKRRSLS